MDGEPFTKPIASEVKPESHTKPEGELPSSLPDIARSIELIAQIPGGFLITDTAGIILEVDHCLAVMLHTSQRRLLGRPFSPYIIHEEQLDFIARLSQIASSRDVFEWRTTLRLRDEVTLPVSLMVCSRPGNRHEPGQMRWLVRDLSTYPETRQSLVRIREDLEKRIKDQTLQMQKIRADLAHEVDYRKRVEYDLKKARQDMETHTRERTQALAVANEMLQAELAERKRLEAESIERARQLGELYSATGALLTTLDLEPLLGQILDAAINAIPTAEKGMIHLVGKDTGQLEMRAVIGYTDPRIQKLNIQTGPTYTMRAVHEGTPILIDDMQMAETSRFSVNIPEAKTIQSAVVAPLLLGDDVLGVISLESSQKRAFTNNDLRLLVSFAATVTVAIRNAQLHGEVQKLAITDSITGLLNRRGFIDLGRREVERARRFMRPLSAILFDIDKFKTVNDTFGHSSGDALLRTVAERVKTNIREVDIMGRYGGDEFAILLPETDLFVATNVAERLRLCVSDTGMSLDNQVLKVTISLGVARLTPDITGLPALMDRADTAMYAAKNAGRNRVEIN